MTIALAGGTAAASLVAMMEARSSLSAEGGGRGPTFGQLLAADYAVLAPLALAVAGVVGVVMSFLEPDRPYSWREHFARARREPVLMRSRTAALAPLLILVAVVWMVVAANLGRQMLARGAPFETGLELAVSSLAVLAALAAVALAFVPPLRRALATGAASYPWLIDPVVTGAFAVLIATLVVGCGVAVGDTSGEGGGVLGVFGVLKRPELDLRPVVDLFAIVAGAYTAPIALARLRVPLFTFLVAALVAFAPLALTIHQAKAVEAEPSIAQRLERGAPLGRIALAVIRRATDRDKDGASPYFGGGDCDDRDPARSPTAVDVPGNGIDEDCSGADTPLPEPEERGAGAAKRAARGALPAAQNLILITVDTLRPDLGFMGYPKPVSPNLDALAEKSVIFDRAYAFASYTGKSVGPLLIGKYPSETLRDGAHFNTYVKANTLVTERFQEAGVRTFGAASHWYFNAWSGLSQGMDEWDLSAVPAGGQGNNDRTVTSKQLTDAALRLLAKPENVQGRFFMWLHYFDPHMAYVPHEGAPNFLAEGARGSAIAKAAYDGEVWFVDQHLGRLFDRVAKEPWGEKTAIVVTADHGEAFAEHGMSWHGHEIWESLVRVPLLVHVPGVAPHHVPVKRGHVDLVPTLLEIMGLEVPGSEELSGESLAPDLLATDGDVFEERDVYLDMPIGPFTGMRRGIVHGPTPGMKLIHFGGNVYNLFDLANDPGEKEDLSSDKERFRPVLEAFQAKRARLKEIEVKPEGGEGH